jgi:hypothetical protein
VSWDNQELDVLYLLENEGGWHWAAFKVQASNATSRITFENIHRSLQMDAFSAIDLSAPPVIVAQPSSVSAIAGGVAAFSVGVSGSAPLRFQWLHNDFPLAGRTNPVLVLESVTPAQAGAYRVQIENNLGAVTSAAATLVVDASTNATILVQPYGDRVPVGGYFNLSVVAGGTPPLHYQWFRNGQAIADATNRNVTFSNVQLTNAGVYDVLVRNYAGSVQSLPATLDVASGATGGGLIDFRNRGFIPGATTNEAPVFNIDGVTRLSGDGFVAQLYAGPTLGALRAVGQPTPFRSGFYAGIFVSQIVILPNIAPGGTAFGQVRAWERTRGTSYEEARALGGRVGRSAVLEVTVGGGVIPALPMVELTSFSLQAGLPSFNVGLIDLIEQRPDGTIVWSLQGEAGFRYSIEKSVRPSAVWQPYLVLTNALGTVTFTDSANSGAGAVFYRARILD